jgi:hypothetical protein
MEYTRDETEITELAKKKQNMKIYIQPLKTTMEIITTKNTVPPNRVSVGEGDGADSGGIN